MDKEYFVIYDIRGIQKYIYKTNRIKEISGASIIVRNLLDELITDYFYGKDFKIVENDSDLSLNEPFIKTNWTTTTEFTFFKNKSCKLEYVYNGGGNLLVAYRGEEADLLDYNKALQIGFLKNSYSLSLAYAYVEINEKSSYSEARKAVKEKLSDIKITMPELVMGKALPVTMLDSITGLPISDVNSYFEENDINAKFHPSKKEEKSSVESALKIIKADSVGQTQLDKILDAATNEKDSDKSMLAVVHIDGNDMGGMISNYINMLSRNNPSFEEEVSDSRNISIVIDEVFNQDIKQIFIENADTTRLIINSGDDITFICLATNAINITYQIMNQIEKGVLAPKNSNSSEYNENTFSSCAGICFIHSHFPFSRACEIAEEVCSLAKAKAKSDRVKTSLKLASGKEYYRPTSYLDYEICDSGFLKSVSELREANQNLYLKPYKTTKTDTIGENHVESLLKLLNLFRGNTEQVVARSSVKELRNTYEKSAIDIKLLMLKLKSRNAFGKDFDYNAFNENGIAKYFDASSMIDYYNTKEEE